MGKFKLFATLSAVLLGAATVSAQTTTLRSYRDATIRGGAYANTNYGYDTVLETRASTDASYTRRSVLQFDTAPHYAESAQIISAKLILTVQGGNPEDRTVAACAVPVSFREGDVSWVARNSGDPWSTPGGDIIAGDCSLATATATPGSQVTFDVTRQVQRAIRGDYGSRYARFRIEDRGGRTIELRYSRDSYKAYFSNNGSGASVQPALVITAGTTTTPATTTPAPAPAPAPIPTPAPTPAPTSERLCDTSFENCRTPLIDLIRAEPHRIDVSMWSIKDARYAAELVKRWNEGVAVRVIGDYRAATGTYKPIIDEIIAAGIPMRRKTSGGINHRKFMLFDGLNRVEFSGANYSSLAFHPIEPYVNYEDESIYFTSENSIVNSFRTIMDDMWVSSLYTDYANVRSRQRVYPTYSIDPDLNFPYSENYMTRTLKAVNAETQQIDVFMYRIADRHYSDALIAAYTQRHVPVRVYSDTSEYRDPTQKWHSFNLDRMWLAGIPIRVPAHQGINHSKFVLLHGQRLTIFGSSNWSTESAVRQAENNYFTTKSWFYNWFLAQFNRKWSNAIGIAESKAFAPQAPPAPSYRSIANGATGVPTTGQKLSWDGGLFAHVYDVYFGTDPSAGTLVARNLSLGPSIHSYTLPTLQPGTRYYWRIVSKTAALKAKSGPVWSFTTR